MTIALWVIQGLLALVFLIAGLVKVTQPLPTLATRMPWTAAVPAPLTRFIGVAEILGALGLLLPGGAHIAPILTPLAASGVVIVMLLATGFHARRGEYQTIAGNIVLLALALLIAVARFTAWPLT